MKPDRQPLRLSDGRHAATVLPTNAMIPSPHGFAAAEDSIGNEENITFWGENCAVRYAKAGHPHVRLGSKADMGNAHRYVRSTRKKADMCGANRNVRYGPIADIGPYYSITSLALARSDGGTVRPSALAVLRLITSSYLVGACTGSSAGFSPLRMRST